MGNFRQMTTDELIEQHTKVRPGDDQGQIGQPQLEADSRNLAPLTALWGILSGLPHPRGMGFPGGSAAPARRSARPRKGFEKVSDPLTTTNRAIADAGTRESVKTAQKGQTAFPWGERSLPPEAEQARANLMEQYAPALYGQTNRVADPNPTPDRYHPVEKSGSGRSANPESKGTPARNLRVPHVASDDLANELMSNEFDGIIMNYKPDSSPASFGTAVRQRGVRASREKRSLESAVPLPEYEALSAKIRAVDREWGGITQPGGGGGEGQTAPDAVVARKLGLTADVVREQRARMARTGVRLPVSFDDLDETPIDKTRGVHRQSRLRGMEQLDETGDVADKRQQALDAAKANVNPRDWAIFEASRNPDNPRKGIELAKDYNVSPAAITKILQKVHKTIQDIYQGRGFQGKMPRKEAKPKSLGAAANEYDTPLSDFQRDRLRLQNSIQSQAGGGSDQSRGRETNDIETNPFYGPKNLTNLPEDVRGWRALGAGNPRGAIGDSQPGRQRRHGLGTIHGNRPVADFNQEPYFTNDFLKYLRYHLGTDDTPPGPRSVGADAYKGPQQPLTNAEFDAYVQNYRRFVNQGGPDKEPDPEIVRQLRAKQGFNISGRRDEQEPYPENLSRELRAQGGPRIGTEWYEDWNGHPAFSHLTEPVVMPVLETGRLHPHSNRRVQEPMFNIKTEDYKTPR